MNNCSGYLLPRYFHSSNRARSELSVRRNVIDCMSRCVHGDADGSSVSPGYFVGFRGISSALNRSTFLITRPCLTRAAITHLPSQLVSQENRTATRYFRASFDSSARIRGDFSASNARHWRSGSAGKRIYYMHARDFDVNRISESVRKQRD